MRCDYLDTPHSNGQTHYRVAGTGAPVLLLHPSPLSSRFMLPTAAALQGGARVIALDTPGYGASDALKVPATDLAPYVDWLLEVLDALGLERAVLYGSATGAQLAIEFARAHTQRTRGIVLDNAAHFEDGERAAILRHYLPSLAPCESGQHLAKTWEICSKLFQFFPWFASDEAHRVGPPASLAAVHATALEYLRAGEDYGRAYRAAFDNEDARRVLDITVPVKVIRWQGSILKAHSALYDTLPWPANVELLPCEAPAEARMACIRRAVSELLQGHVPGPLQ